MNKIVYIEVERRCNLRCRYCMAWKSAAAAPNPLADRAGLARLAAFLARLEERGYRTLALTGGEPTLYPLLLDLVALGRRLGLRPTLMTNGIGVDAALAARLAKAGCSEVFVSLDALSEPVNRALRSAAAPVLQAIAALHAAGLPVDITCVLSRQNLAVAPGLLQLARRLGCQLSVSPVYVPPADPDYARLSLGNLSQQQRRQLADLLQSLSDYDPDRAPYYRFIAACYVHGHEYAAPAGCNIAQDTLVVRMEGDVFYCFHRGDRYGNLLSGDLAALLARIDAGPPPQGLGQCFGEHCYSLHADNRDLPAAVRRR